MTERLPVRLDKVDLRLPEHGRIRTGEKNGKGGRRSIPNFRFTSRDEKVLGQVADMYGGTVQPWRDRSVAPGQFELRTSANQVDVALPSEPWPLSINYELWSGGGCQRRCDTYTCQAVTPGPDGSEMEQQDCICWATKEMACTLKIRLNVILPDVDFGGTWRLETSSENAHRELPPMVNLITGAGGLQRAVLSLEKREEMRFGKKKMFQVPKLAMTHTLTELAQGAARVGALPEPATQVALPVRSEVVDAYVAEAEDDVLEAEIVFDPVTGPHPINTDLCDKYMSEKTNRQRMKALLRARELALEMGEPVPAEAEEISYPLIDALMAEGA